VKHCGAGVPPASQKLDHQKAGETPAPQEMATSKNFPIQWTRPKIDFVDPRTLPFVERQSRGELPHLYKEGGSYFVTFRLWDAVVSKEQHDQWAALHRQFEDEKVWADLRMAQRVAEATEPPLKSGSCLLSRDDIAETVQSALLYFHSQRYNILAWCVMSNHVHVAYTALCRHTPEDIHHSWKSYLSHEINRMYDRSGTLWERESFDHLIRSVEHYEAYIDYIERNPLEAGLCERPEDWEHSSARYCGAG